MDTPRSSYPDPSLTERQLVGDTSVVYRLALLILLSIAALVVAVVIFVAAVQQT